MVEYELGIEKISHPHSPVKPSDFSVVRGEAYQLAIFKKGSRKYLAHIQFHTHPNCIEITGSDFSESKSLAFYRTYKQSPFRLLEYAVFTEAKRAGINQTTGDYGIRDKGRGHLLQEAEGLFGPEDRGGWHELKDFPRVRINTLERIIKRKEPVPKRLLPPWSAHRQRRSASHTDLKKGVSKRREIRKRLG